MMIVLVFLDTVLQEREEEGKTNYLQMGYSLKNKKHCKIRTVLFTPIEKKFYDSLHGEKLFGECAVIGRLETNS